MLFLFSIFLGITSGSISFFKIFCEILASEKNEILKVLNFGGNLLSKNIEVMKLFGNSMKINRSIIDLNLEGNDFGKNFEAVKILLDFLEFNPTLQILNLDNNELGSNLLIMKEFKLRLLNGNKIRKLSLNLNDLGDNEENLENLKDMILCNENTNSLKEIELRDNYIGYNIISMKILRVLLQKNLSLNIINLGGNMLKEKYFSDIEDLGLRSDLIIIKK